MKNDDEMYQSLLSRWDEYKNLQNKRKLIKKLKSKKIFLRSAAAVAVVCGSMCICFSTYAVWNIVIKPIVIEEDKQQSPVTTQTSIVSQTELHTETTQTKCFNEIITVTETITKQTTATTAVSVTDLDDKKKEEAYTTQPIQTTTATTIETLETEMTTTTMVTETTSTEAQTTVAITMEGDEALSIYKNYLKSPAEAKPVLEISGKEYYAINNNIDNSELDSYEITQETEQQINVVEFLADNCVNGVRETIVIKDTIEVKEINADEGYVIVYFPRQDIYALYALNDTSENE